MRMRSLLAVCLGLAVGACAEDSQPSNEGQTVEEQSLGTLSLQLTGADSSGRAYRLRNAEFRIQGWGETGYEWSETTLSSEEDLDAPYLETRLAPGYYEIGVLPYGWYLERLSDGAWEQVEQAVLLSSAWQSVYVRHGLTTSVAFRFGVDGELIDFRAGTVRIGIEIEQPGEAPPCNPFPFPLPFPITCLPDGGVIIGDGDAGGDPDGGWGFPNPPVSDGGWGFPEPVVDAGVTLPL
jgi:hypothetical protein